MYLIVIFISQLICYLGAAPASQWAEVDGRVVGGSPANITNYPYQLSLEWFFRHNCGAAIISRDWAVTAAHCIHEGSISVTRLRAGSSYRNSGGTLHQASEVIIHPNYDSTNYDYDIAVIKVSDPFEYGESVQPIPLSSVAPPTGTAVTLTGWGKLSATGSLASQLQQVQLNIVDFNVCNGMYFFYGGVTERMICAGDSEGEKDACEADSGGPLVAEGQLVGIVSWGAGCATEGYPAGVYTDVAVMKSWVLSTSGIEE